MVGAAELMRLNRLQMLKESRGQQCKRPDSKRVHKQETLQAPQGPTGDMTNRWVISVSFFQHKVIPLFPPLSLQHYGICQSPSWQHSSHFLLINTVFAKFTISAANLVQIYSFILCFIPFLYPSLCLWPVLCILCFFTVMPLCVDYRGIYLLET